MILKGRDGWGKRQGGLGVVPYSLPEHRPACVHSSEGEATGTRQEVLHRVGKDLGRDGHRLVRWLKEEIVLPQLS